MFSFGRSFFSPSGRPQELQRGGGHSNQSASSGFIGSTASSSPNIHTIPTNNPDSNYTIEDPIHIKVKNWFQYFPLCSNIIFCVCIILYIVQGTFNEPKSSDVCYTYSSIVKSGQAWKLFTFAFFHGSMMHILFNMLALYQLGNRIESTLGTIYFFFLSLLLILISPAIWLGIDALLIDGFKAGSALSFMLDRCTVGYSGVLFGYLVLTVQYKPLYSHLYPGANYADFAPKLIPFLMLIISSFLMPNVSFMGHLTGMLGGYVVWLLVRYVKPLNRFFLLVDSKVPKILRDRTFYFVSSETVFTEAETSSSNDIQNEAGQTTPSSGTSFFGGGRTLSSTSWWEQIKRKLTGLFRGNESYNQLNEEEGRQSSGSAHNWGGGRSLGNN